MILATIHFQIGTPARFVKQSPQKSTLVTRLGVKYPYVVDPPFVVGLSQRCSVTNDSPDPGFLQQFKEFHCSDCGSNVGFRSRRRTLTERYLLRLLLLQPVRCGECFRRDYRPIFTQVKDRLSEISGMIPVAKVPKPASHKRNVA